MPDLRSDPLADGIASADLRRVLASLDPTDRALIALRYVAELSSDEIGRALGMSSSAPAAAFRACCFGSVENFAMA